MLRYLFATLREDSYQKKVILKCYENVFVIVKIRSCFVASKWCCKTFLQRILNTLASRLFQPYLISYEEGQFHRHLVGVILFWFVCFNWSATYCLFFFSLPKNIKLNVENNTQAAHFTKLCGWKRFSEVSLFLFVENTNFPLVFEYQIWRKLKARFQHIAVFWAASCYQHRYFLFRSCGLAYTVQSLESKMRS